ncbi:MAG TPA: pinensin family lanthipeptide [Ignavibacteria bacterium]|nr:pinensin family lanthipeptide [Ignavibacteria bacterium]
MKEKKARMKLEDIKVESFVTALDENNANRLMGKTDDIGCLQTPLNCTVGSRVVCCVPTPVIKCPD